MNEIEREKEFLNWLKINKNLSDNTRRNYTNRLKNKIPEKLYELDYRNNRDSLYNSSLEELEKINLLFKNNEYSLQEWNRTPTIGSEAWNSLKYLIDYFKNIKNEKLGNSMPKQTQPLNQILYGSPGTGKTYHTINKAIEIIDNEFFEQNKDDRKALKDKFEEYKKAGQIEFVTFHQSYGYEEFVEGIKAKTTDKGIEYKIEKGIFKKLSNKAKENFENSKKTVQQLIQEKTQKQKLEIFLNDSLENEKEFLKTKGGKFKIKELNQDEITIYTEDSNYSDKTLILLIDEFLKILNSDIEIKNSKQMAKDVFGVNNQRQKDTYYLSMYNEFRKLRFDDIEEIKSDEPLKNYILIIDEINRGNISKIFGELITLIEPSKRIGADEEIKVKLPYSGDDFGVPSNLYIIGTMNTADRSIAPIDTALRRRFIFEEMAPNPDLLKFITVKENEEDKIIELDKLLEAINTRIEYLYDRDHTIGHAYLIDVKDLDDLRFAFKNKIIPLLAEYFYEDWENIDLVLNQNGFIVPNNENKSYLSEKITKRIQNKVTYKVSDKNWEIENFKKIYESEK